MWLRSLSVAVTFAGLALGARALSTPSSPQQTKCVYCGDSWCCKPCSDSNGNQGYPYCNVECGGGQSCSCYACA